MPGHADEEGAVVAVVGGPPGLRVGHEGVEVGDEGVEVEGLELGRVVEVGVHGVGEGLLFCAQDGEVEAVGPPLHVADDLARGRGDGAVQGRFGFGRGDAGRGATSGVGYGALHFFGHCGSFGVANR